MKKLYVLLLLGLLPYLTFSQQKQDVASKEVKTSKVGSDIKGFAMYPNPANRSSFITITSTKNMHKDILVYDVFGKEILKKQITNNLLDVASLQAGVYIMKVVEDGFMTTRKLVIK